jgi:hypothetical protein
LIGLWLPGFCITLEKDGFLNRIIDFIFLLLLEGYISLYLPSYIFAQFLAAIDAIPLLSLFVEFVLLVMQMF